MARRILAVVAGFAAWSVIWLLAGRVIAVVDPSAFQEDGSAGSSGVLVLLILAAAVASVVSGWLAAVIGGEDGRRAVVILAVLLLAVGLAVEIGTWGLAPAWYHLIFLGLLVPLTVLGGNLKRLPG